MKKQTNNNNPKTQTLILATALQARQAALHCQVIWVPFGTQIHPFSEPLVWSGTDQNAMLSSLSWLVLKWAGSVTWANELFLRFLLALLGKNPALVKGEYWLLKWCKLGLLLTFAITEFLTDTEKKYRWKKEKRSWWDHLRPPNHMYPELVVALDFPLINSKFVYSVWAGFLWDSQGSRTTHQESLIRISP